MITGEMQTTDRDELLRRRLAGGAGGRRSRIPRADRSEALPLSSGQQQMWFLNRLDSDSAEYLVPLVLRLRGRLDVAALGRAWAELPVRHEILRTRYTMRDGRPVQVIDPASTAGLRVRDLTGEPAVDREAQARAVAEQESRIPFDLERDQPFRGTLLRLAEDDHLLVAVFHHIACDAWSTRLFGRELGELYRAATTGSPAPPQPELQYADYAVWEQQQMSGENLDRQLGYWREQLAGIAPLELPTDRPRTASAEREGTVLSFAFPAGLPDRVRALAREHDATAFMVLLTAFQVLLARHTGRTDVAVGTAVSGRNRPELQHLFGYGINSLVLRSQWSDDPTFAALLARARIQVLGAFDHQEVPFARLVDELQPERDLTRTPLFQVIFDLVEPRTAVLDLPGLQVEALTTDRRVARFDLTFQVEATADGGLTGHLEYATALFDRETAQRLTGHYLELLTAVTGQPQLRVSDVGLLTPAERDQLVRGWNDTAAAGVTSRVDQSVERQVQITPDAVAVIAGDRRLSFAELDARANQFAHRLAAFGAGPGQTVGVLLDRSPDLVACLLGIWRTGAAYVPLDPTYPVDRLAFMLTDTGTTTVVTETANRDRLPTGSRLLLIDEDEPLGRAPRTAPPVADRQLDDLAYVIYTSGSTGTPKGVLVGHRGLANYIEWTVGAYAAAGRTGAPLFSSIAFDLGIPDLYTPLVTGRPVTLMPQQLDVADLGRSLVEAGPFSFVKLTPGHADLLCEQLSADELAGLAGLVIAAGDAFTGRLANRWLAKAGPNGTRLAAEYGPTEITIGNSDYRVDGPQTGELVPIGRPIRNTTMYVLDENARPVPIGVVGEVYIGGTGLAWGYANRPALTAERFVPDPFGAPGARLYRSGDLAFVRSDGNFEFVGRVDDQVKIRGYRIELGEIQAVLSERADLRDAVVVAHDSGSGERRLVAYCVPAGPQLPAPAELAAHCAAVLPEYMVPVAFLALDRIPLTANGKLDRRALPAPDRAALDPGQDYLAPRTPTEEQVAAVWTEVLEVAQVGVRDGFFDLGGDSIRAVALVGSLRAAGFDVSVRDVFEYRSVEKLSEFVDGRPAPAAAQHRVQPFELLPAVDRERLPADAVDAYPLSQVQTGMLVEMLIDDGVNRYHNVTSFRILDDQPFNEDALRAAADLLVERHEILRTSLDLTGYSTPVQVVHASAEIPIGSQDLRALDENEQDRVLRRFTAQERAQLFDLARPPLFRLFAHVCGEKVWWLSTAECHPILEGWSHHSLLMELMTCYRRIRDGLEPEPLEPTEVRYADFIAAELQTLESDEDRAYWQGVVQDYPRFTVPPGWGDDPGTPRQGYVTPVLFQDLEDGLRELAARAQTSLKSVLLAAQFAVLSRLTDQPEFCAGIVCNARPEAVGADRVPGMYLNTLPFAFERGARTWRDLVQQVFAREVELWPHRRFPMPVIQREFNDGERLLEVSCSYQDFHQVDTTLIDFLASIDDSPTEFALSTSLRPGYFVLTTNTHTISRATMPRLVALYRGVLEAMVADPEGDATASILPTGEWDRVIRDGNTSPALIDQHTPLGSVPARFEAQARRTPDAVAVQATGRSLSYRELDEHAGRLARYLHRTGLGTAAEPVVGVLLDRGVDLMSTLLGIWKAGAAYLPLDPSYPMQRVAGMLADAGVSTVVTQTAHAAAVPAGVTRVVLDEAAPAAAIAAELPFTGPAPDLDRLAYVIFTSGSTGRPKGVAVSHTGLANHIAWAARDLADRGTGGGAVFSSVAFDLVAPNLWAPLVIGQRVWLAEQGLDLADLPAALAAAGPFSFLKLTPGHLDVLAHRLTGEQARSLASVIVVAGEPFTATTLNRWRALDPDTELVNEYGPTEASVGTCIFPLSRPGSATGDDVVPIGRPLPGLRMYVLDNRMQPVPLGVAGELYVGGTGVARGYLGRPAATAERFVPDPFSPRPGARLYRTGDLVRRRADGAVEFLRRLDDQVKIRGYRIELGEIRAVLAAHSGVADAVVVAAPTAAGETALVAYLVPNGSTAPAVEELRRHAGAQLPDYMVPTAFVELERIPLTANGKLDRRGLPDAESVVADRAVTTAPRTETERRIAAIWCAVLERDEVDVQDNFFHVGGHSIRAVALVGALRAAGFDVAVRDVFEFRTVAELSRHLGELDAPASPAATVARFALIDAADRDRLPDGVSDAYPMSQVQAGMVIEMLADREQHAYHNVSLFRIRDAHPFDLSALRRAAALVVERHEVLRSSFDLTNYSVPMQLVHEQAEMAVGELDLRDSSDFTRARDEFTARERAALFDVGTAPLLRITGLIENTGAWWLGLTVCHAITEGWSHRSLLMELLECYRQLRDGHDPDPVDRPAVRYADFIAAELEALNSPDQQAFWQDVIDRHAKFTLPAGWAAPAGTPGERFRAGVPLRDLHNALHALADSTGTSLKSLLLAAHLSVLGRITEEPAFHSGLVTSARPEADGVDTVYGMYLNTVPFGFERRARTWRQLIEQVFAQEGEIWAHRTYPMPAVQQLSGLDRLLDVRFSYQDFHQVDDEVVDVEASLGEGATEFPLAVSAVAGYLVLTTQTRVISREDAQRLVELYRAVLEAMIADPDASAEAGLLPTGDWRRAVIEPNAITTDLEVAGPVPLQIAKQVSRTPHAMALQSDSATLSYAELEARANRLARELRARGVTDGTDAVVAVMLERSVDLLVTLLAVWKAGAAYLPLEPGQPGERVARMLTDARVGALIRHQATQAPGGNWPQIVLDDPADAAAITAQAPTAPEVTLDPDGLAYVIFTSGSTGRPKGVAVTHRTLANHVAWAVRDLAGRGDGGGALFSSVAFDLVVPNLWAPLVTGQRLWLAPPDLNLGRLGQHLNAAGPFSFLKLTPGHLGLLFEQLNTEQAAALAEVVVVGGELLLGPVADRCLQLLGPGRLVNEYGPTEATVGTCVFPVTEPNGSGGVPIGRPLPGMRMYVLDAGMNPVPIGVPGELYVGGVGVVRGYVHQSRLTAERFVPDPFGEPGTRLYRTGDLVRHRRDGAVEFLHRLDDQIKIRGYRIELGEIRAALLEHPDLSDAVVTTKEPTPGDHRLVAYLVTAPGATAPDPAALAAYCADRLPDYMIPGAFLELERIPLTTNGKLDQRELPDPDRADLRSDQEYQVPQTPTERALAEIWSRVLGVAQVGLQDRFFDLGGHSLLMIQVLAAAREAGLTIAVWRMYQQETLSDLAAAVDADAAAALTELTEPALAEPEADPLAEYAGGPARRQGPFWLNRMPCPALPFDHPEPADGPSRSFVDELPAGLSQAVIGGTDVDPGTGPDRAADDRISELVLTALGLVVADWTGGDRVLVEIVDQTSPAVAAAPGPHRYPLALWVPARQAPDALRQSVADQVRAVPDRGLAHGLLRNGPDDDLAVALRELPEPELSFGYLGRHQPSKDGTTSRPLALTVAVVADTVQLGWTYTGRHDESTVRGLTAQVQQRLRDLVGVPVSTTGVGDEPEALAGELRRVMAEHSVPGASVLLLRDGEVAQAHSVGVRTTGSDEPVTDGTLFHAGSISKHVTTLGTLRLVEAGRLELDRDVNHYLTSWRIPDGEPAGPITVRHLLGNTSGLLVTPNPGYRRGEPLPTLLDLLTGRDPIRTPPVRRELVPGQSFRKSNVNWSVLQQVLTDVTGERFEDLMASLVLGPLGMGSSSYLQSHPETSGLPVATGHDQFGEPLDGGWRVRLEVAAAGLWTTAADVARVAREYRRAALGQSALIDRSLAEAALTPNPGGYYGLGTIVDRTGGDVEFGHGGEPIGYHHMAISRVAAGTGFVVLTNGESGRGVVKLLVAEVARQDRHFAQGRLAGQWADDPGRAGLGTAEPPKETTP